MIDNIIAKIGELAFHALTGLVVLLCVCLALVMLAWLTFGFPY